MKTFDVDAKQLIRNYVESIEEYIRNHTRLHPNEIDGLLNEINDFVYIRSRELTTGDRVGYSNVLKAIEECGSPSEISEQYLDLEQTDARDTLSEEEINFRPKVNSDKKRNEESDLQKGDKQIILSISSERMVSLVSILSLKSSYRDARIFSIYRVCFFFLIAFQIFALITSIPRGNFYPNVNYLSDEICLRLTVYAAVLILLECWVVNRWKTNLEEQKRIKRIFDDELIIWLSRIGFLILFLKSSLIYAPAYIIFTPIWIIFAIIVEKSLNSKQWQNVISSKIAKLGMVISGNEQSGITLSGRIRELRTKYSNLEIGISIIPSFILILSFFIVPFTPMSNWGAFIGISILGMVLTLILIIYFRSKDSEQENLDGMPGFHGESDLIAWIIRLLALKTIIMASTQYSVPDIYFQVLIVLIWIVSEFLLNSKSREIIKSGLGGILLQVSGSDSPYINSDNQMNVSSLKQNSSSSKVSPTIKITGTEQPIPDSVQQVHQVNSTSPPIDVKSNDLQKKQSFWLFRFIGAIMIALVMSISMLIVTIFEVALIFTIFLTNFTEYGSYQLPSFTFDTTYWNIPDNIFPAGSYVIPSFTIYVWHALLVLAIQIFIIAVLEYYGTAIKRPEGVVVFLGRNISRLLIFMMSIGSIIRFVNSSNNYILIELMLLSILLVFNEVNAWKVRSERKTWKKENTVFHPNNEINEEVSQTHPGTS